MGIKSINCTDMMAGSLEVKSVGPVTERLLIRIPKQTKCKSVDVLLSKALNLSCFA